MATTSYLYHTMGLKNYRHLRTEYRQGKVFHHVRLKNTKRMCRGCFGVGPSYLFVFFNITVKKQGLSGPISRFLTPKWAI